MWIEATLNNTPVATVLQTFKPIFERNIKDTREATPQEIEPFTPPPAEGFENKDSIRLTRAGLPENGVTAAVTGEGAIGGSSSFKIDYPDTEDWLLAARTDESKVKLPAFHRYVIKFDYKTLSGDTRLNLTTVSYTHLVWLKCPGGMGSWAFFDELLEKANVVGTPGAGFGRNGEGFFRLTAFGSQENTREAVRRLREIYGR